MRQSAAPAWSQAFRKSSIVKCSAQTAEPRVQPSFRALCKPGPSPPQALSRCVRALVFACGQLSLQSLVAPFTSMVQEGQKREREEELEGPPRELEHTPRARTPQPVLEAIPEEELEEEMVGPVLPQPKKRKVRNANCREARAWEHESKILDRPRLLPRRYLLDTLVLAINNYFYTLVIL